MIVKQHYARRCLGLLVALAMVLSLSPVPYLQSAIAAEAQVEASDADADNAAQENGGGSASEATEEAPVIQAESISEDLGAEEADSGDDAVESGEEESTAVLEPAEVENEDATGQAEETAESEEPATAQAPSAKKAPARASAAKDVYIDNSVDESVSYVVGVIKVTDAVTKEVTTATVYSSSAPVSYSDPKPSAVDALIVEAIQALWEYADDNGYVYDIDQSMEPVQDNRKVWDNRKYETIEEGGADTITGGVWDSTDGEYTRTHIASGGYGKETYFTVTLAVMTAKTAPDTTDDPTDTTEPTDTPEPANTEEPTDTTEPADGEEPTDTTEPADGEEPTDTTEPADGEEPADTTKPAAEDEVEPAAAAKPAVEGSHAATGLPVTGDPMRALPGLLAAMAACGLAMLFAAIRLRPARPRGKHARR